MCQYVDTGTTVLTLVVTLQPQTTAVFCQSALVHARVRMPMQYAETAWLNSDQGCTDIFRRQEVVRINHPGFAALGSMREGRTRHAESVLVAGFDATSANRSLVLRQRCG